MLPSEVSAPGFKRDTYDLRKLDAFSVGSTIYFIIFKEYITNRNTKREEESDEEWIRRMHISGTIEKEVQRLKHRGAPKGVPPRVFDIMLSLLETDSGKRASVSSCLQSFGRQETRVEKPVFATSRLDHHLPHWLDPRVAHGSKVIFLFFWDFCRILILILI
jgi:hypothetical protein